METTDTVNTLYLDVCAEFIKNRFGNDTGIIRRPGLGCIHANMVPPEDGESVCWFDENLLRWVETTQRFTSWAIMDDGKVYVGDPEDASAEGDLYFHVGHPREVAELIHLFVQPAAKLVSDLSESRFMKLGKVADLYALIPTGDGWRMFDLARMPDDVPGDFRTALGLNLVQKWEGLISGDSFEAWRFAERWPDFVRTLPDAAPLLRAGYVYKKTYCFGHGLRLLAGRADMTDPFLPFLVVPSQADVSSLYLAEYLNRDAEACAQLESALAEENDLAMVCALLAKISIRLPSAFTDQIRLAAQTNLLRQRVLQSAENLVCCRTSYRNLGVRYQAAAQALYRMVEVSRQHSGKTDN